VNKIIKARPDVIFSTINGDSNVAFFKQLKAAGITARDIPVMSVSIAEEEVRGIGGDNVAGHYAVWNYFMSQDTPENKVFVENYKNRFGQDRVTDDPIEAQYINVKVWAMAVEKAGSDDVNAIREAARGLEYLAPEGPVRLDAENQHYWKIVQIGKHLKNGQFKIVWSTPGPVRPKPWSRFTNPDKECVQSKGGTITIAAADRGADYEIMSDADIARIGAGIAYGSAPGGSLESRVERLEKWMNSFESR
jgi:urea transport system substrate-binding protein